MRIILRCFHLLLFLQIPNGIAAQSILPYAQSVVDTLSSPHFAGRGYLNDSDGRAAIFIGNEFASHGLYSFTEDFSRPFTISVDVFPENPVLKIDNLTRQAGIDFLPFPGSSSGSGENVQKIVYAGTGLLLPDLNVNQYQNLDIKNAIVVIEESIPDSIRTNESVKSVLLSPVTRITLASKLGARAVILLHEGTLSQSYSPSNLPIPAFLLRKKIWSGKINEISYELQSKQDWQTTTSNLNAVVPGKTDPDTYLVISAHYDHLGSIGPDFYFPGANDNASGVALTLALARYFKENPLNKTIVFIEFTAEEQGLQGSRFFVENPLFPLEEIRFLINLDMVASGSRGIMVVGGSDFEPEFELLQNVNDRLGLGRLGKRPNAPNSDHYFFLQAGVRGFFLYTDKGAQPYHHPNDLPSTLEWDDFMNTYELVKNFLIELDRIQ